MSKFSMKIATSVAVIGGIVAGAVSASAALNLPTMSCSYMFNTNMKLGSRGASVMDLQKVLNMYPQTQVAESGAGSPGMETSTFGPATKRAVNKFQALHLVELGITAPTGNVFAGTRGLLNQVCSGSNNNQSNNNNNNSNNTTVVSGPVSASLAMSQPTGMIVQGQSGARLADITFTGNGTVTSLQLQRIGVSANSALNNVYLYDGNTRITDAASVVTSGAINFNSTTGLFTVNGSRTITVRADIAGSTNGQSVGVSLTSVTAGGSVSTFSNVVGNTLQIGSVTTAGVNFSAISPTTVYVDAGTQAYNVWEGTANVSTRDVYFRAATFKFVGSAPVDAVANLSLYVDGTKIAGPSMINAANNNKVTFDLGNTPYLLKTGSHTIDLRGDIVKGSNRTISFSIENVADLMLEDSNLVGVNVSATVNSSTLTQGNSVYNTISVNKGSVTVNVDPSFTTNKVTGGATNVPVGQFTMKAYGEDVKVNTLRVTFATTTVTTLNNVSLYVNGGQVGNNQNFAGQALSFTLGSSLIIPAGQTVTLTVKADVVDGSNAAYTSGTVAAVIGGVANNAQGQSSNELVSVAGSGSTASPAGYSTGNVLTVSSGAGSFARTAGFTAVTVAPNTPNVKIGSYTVQAGSAEDIKINSATVYPNFATYDQTNLSNLTLKSNGVVVGTPIGNPTAASSTFSFTDIVVAANGTRTFDIYADIGGASSGSVTMDMAITYRGSVSNTTITSAASGVAISSSAATLAAPTLVSSSPVAQYVVGGTTFGIATYKLATASAGTQATVRELRFVTAGDDSIESITVGGVTAPVIGGGTTTVSGLNIAVSSTGTDVPVTVKFSGFQNSTTGGSLQTSVSPVAIKLGYVEGTSGSGSVITKLSTASSSNMILVASKPTLTVSSTQGGTLILGAENKVGEFTVSADANGKISISTTTVNLSAIGVTVPQFASTRVADGATTISSATVTGSSTATIVFSPAYEISAGQSKTFSVYSTVTGVAQSGITPYVASSLSASGFYWNDVIGGNTSFTGSSILNFPTNSWTTAR